jgi:hypothetical protein
MSTRTRKSATRQPGRQARADHPDPPWYIDGEPAPPAGLPVYRDLDEQLLVCLQHPFDAVGDSSLIESALVPAGDGLASHQWKLQATLEMHPPRFFEGWATRGHFTLDLTVGALARPAAGNWGDSQRTSSATGSCRVLIMRDARGKVVLSLESDAHHATEKPMPRPEEARFLNGDVAFRKNGSSGLSVAASAAISAARWAKLIAGSSAATDGLAFDGKWRRNLEDDDGAVSASGTFAFAVMTHQAYRTLCDNQGWPGHIG